MKTKKISQDKKQGIRFKRQNKRNEQKRKKNKSVDEIQRLLKRFLITINGLKKSKVKSEPKPEESIAKRVKLRRKRLDTIEEKEKKNITLFSYYFDYFQSKKYAQ